MCKVIGLTGPTGAGKSAVSAFLREKGCHVVDCDVFAKQVMDSDAECLKKLRHAFGDCFDDNKLNRKKLGKLVFSDKLALKTLNDIVNPLIIKALQQYAKDSGEEVVIFDGATLIECGAAPMCSALIGVLASKETRLQRIMARDGLSQQLALDRIGSQHDDDYYRSHCTHVVYNDSELFAVCDQVINIIKEAITMSELTFGQELAKQLCAENTSGCAVLSDEELAAADEFCVNYMSFLDNAKTEREAVREAVSMLQAAGYQLFDKHAHYEVGDKVYMVNRKKALIAATIGKKGLDEGVHISAAHIDSPRLDLKPRPLYETDGLGLFKTHYYGGIKKYQWTAIPLALHGVIIKTTGECVDVCVGEDENDPVFCVTDLLPHLAADQMKRTLADGIRGEELNVLIGSRQFKDDQVSERVKLNLLNILFQKYGITEHDFLSAELEVVPAFKAKDIGFDRSMIGSYGHDDRVCAYTALMAEIGAEMPEYTTVTVLADKEETGSDGNTGLNAAYLNYFICDLAECFGFDGRSVLSKSKCLSADVNAAFDPTFGDVHEKMNAAFVNHGVVVTKYTGARGKGGTSDASAEFVAYVRNLMDSNNVLWQTGELGKVDQGGGGTVALCIANLDVDVVDVGVPVLSMHAPFEVVSKIDVYMTFKAFEAFYK